MQFVVNYLKVTKVGNFWFLYPLVLSKREDLAFSVSRLFEKKVFILQFLNDKMHNFVKQNIIVQFIIQKLKNKHTSFKIIQTEKAEEPLILTEQEERKTRYFAP